MDEHERDIPNSQNSDKKEDSKKQESSSKPNKSIEEMYEELITRRKKQELEDAKVGKGQGGQEEESKKDKKVIGEGKRSKDIVRKFVTFISSPNQNFETLQYGRGLAKEKYQNKEITEKQFKNLEKLVEDRLFQLGKGKIERTSERAKRQGQKEPISTDQELIVRRKKLVDEKGKLNQLSESAIEIEVNGGGVPDELRKESNKLIKKNANEMENSVKGERPEKMLLDLNEKFDKERPGFSKENQANFEKWFREKIYAINEEYSDERSDTNFTLLWELRQALNSLWPKENDSPTEKDRINKLRKELTKEFEAHMGFHNFIYLYRRVSGVGDVVTATNLVNMKNIRVLMGKQEVIDYLKIFEEKGKEYKKLEEEKSKLDWRKRSADMKEDVDPSTGKKIKYSSNVGKFEKKQDEIIKYLKNLQNGESEQLDEDGQKMKLENAWAAIMAGGLFSALQGTARYGVILSTGDFFFGRPYNIPTYMKERWENKWRRNPFEDLYSVLDLKLKNIWEKNIEGNLNNLPEVKKKLEELDDGHITTEAVNFLDADEVRKKILKPGELADSLSDAKLKSMLESVNHLKGEERSEWFKNVFEQIVIYYKDRNFSLIQNLPDFLRRANAKKDSRNVRPWTKEDIKWKILAFGDILTDKHKEDLLEEFVGNRFQRGFFTFTKSSMPVVLNAIWGGVKGFFGSFFKYVFGENK